MAKITREQIESLKRIYDREQDSLISNVEFSARELLAYPEQRIQNLEYLESYIAKMREGTRSYLEFRRTASNHTSLGCVMIHSGNIWLGIEPDGHTHS